MTDHSQNGMPDLTEAEVDRIVDEWNKTGDDSMNDTLDAAEQFGLIDSERHREMARLVERRDSGELNVNQFMQGVDIIMRKAVFATEEVVLRHRPLPPPGYGPTEYVTYAENMGGPRQVEGIDLDDLPASRPLELIRLGFPVPVAVMLDIAYRHGKLASEMAGHQIGQRDAEAVRRILYH